MSDYDYDYDGAGGGDELSLVDEYFPKDEAPAESYDDGDAVPDASSGRSAEMDLVTEYRESDFDAGEVQGWRQAEQDILGGDYSADDYLAAYEADDGDDDGEYAEPEPGLSPDEALAALMELPQDQLAEGIKYLEQNHPGLGQPLLEAYVDRQEKERLTESWAHLENLNQVLADQQDRQAQEEDAQFAEAEQVARGMVADEFQRAGAGRIDVGVGLQAARDVGDTQVKAWEQAGYSPEEIDSMLTPEFAAWCIQQAAELGRQASIHHHALGKV